MSLAFDPKEMRRAPREEVCYRCEFSVSDLGMVTGLIVNVSALGCMVRCSRPVQPDSHVTFTLPVAGAMEARIAWVMGGRIGLEFSRQIDADPFVEMLSHLRRPADEMGSY